MKNKKEDELIKEVRELKEHIKGEAKKKEEEKKSEAKITLIVLLIMIPIGYLLLRYLIWPLLKFLAELLEIF